MNFVIQVKYLISTKRFNQLKAKRITRTLKQLGKEGKLKKVIQAIVQELDSDAENQDEINSDDEFWKTEPIDRYFVRPTFVTLIPKSILENK